VKRLALAALLLSGCTVGPDYKPPAAEVAPDWKSPVPPGATSAPDDTVLAQWWTSFGDPELTALVDAAIAGNRDLAQAKARVREARALREIAASGGRPQMAINGSAQRIGASGNAIPNHQGSLTTSLYDLGFDAAWELDIFGGVERSVEAADADLAAADEDRRDVLVSLLGEVGGQWVRARGALRRLAIAQESLASQQDTAELTRARRDAGMANDLDLSRALALVAGTRSLVPSFQEDFARACHALDVLMGQPPGAAEAMLTGKAELPPPPPSVPVGLPSDLLRRRPDVRRAERELAAATARIGVASAENYPRFLLTGGIGLSSLETGNLFSAGSKNWNLGLGLNWPIFSGGRISANIEAADARAEQAMHAWETSVLVALQETHDALVAYGREQERLVSLEEQATAQRQAATLARQRHEAGLSDFLEVLDAERSELSAEDELAISQATLAGNAIALYKALGGGWDATQPTEGEPADATTAKSGDEQPASGTH
jgi:NodT family efflux transporter outer membrane factor (OMF) lipoprotein